MGKNKSTGNRVQTGQPEGARPLRRWGNQSQKVIITTGDGTVTFWRTGPDTLTASDGSDGPTAFRRAK